jgi:hypothetical protein
MKAEAIKEYEIIKLLREIQIMRRLNMLSNWFFEIGEHPFVPELIDIITPVKPNSYSRLGTQSSMSNVMPSKSEVLDMS